MAAASPSVQETVAPQVLMTVTGPLQPAEVSVDGPLLCREWLLNDQSELVQCPESPPPNSGAAGVGCALRAGDRLALGNLLSARRWPLVALSNLHLSPEDAMGELAGALKSQRGAASLVVVCTPRPYWTSAAPGGQGAALRALSLRAGVPIVAGTAPEPGRPSSEADLAAEAARLVADLAVGYEAPGEPAGERVRPGLLGELPLGPGAGPPAAQALALRACVEAQRRSGAPLLLSGPVSPEALAVLEGRAGAGAGPCLWERCAFFDVPPDSPVPAAELAGRGAYLGFCPPPGAADVAWQAYPGRRPWATERAFLAALADGRAGRTLVSSGLRFRTDLAACGGAGLAHAPELLARAAGGAAAPGSGPAPPDARALGAAAVAFLQYPWQPPRPPERAVRTVECHWCGAERREGEHFSKLGFSYCSPRCIAGHRQVDFAPDKRERG